MLSLLSPALFISLLHSLWSPLPSNRFYLFLFPSNRFFHGGPSWVVTFSTIFLSFYSFRSFLLLYWCIVGGLTLHSGPVSPCPQGGNQETTVESHHNSPTLLHASAVPSSSLKLPKLLSHSSDSRRPLSVLLVTHDFRSRRIPILLR